ncbi:MAG: DUF4114 domain-containing protein [Verrucomicrobiales bacterium]|nr:DUF4114 domain-containing protein [Verrucomicrobiales bacterium]
MKIEDCYAWSCRLFRALTLMVVTMVPPVDAWQVPESMSDKGRLGLSQESPVAAAGSDAASASFQADALPKITSFLNTKLSEAQTVDASAMLLDPAKLQLKTASDVRVYFVGEGAGYHNTLGYTTDGSGSAGSESAALIFPDASSPVSSYDPLDTVRRTGNAPLLPGDFVDLGTLDGGTLLDFFLIADGANGGKNVYSTQTSVNPDGINHVVAFSYALPDSPYLIIGFEDLYGGGDQDYNDLLFAVDIGAANIKALTANSEPGLAFILGGFGLLAWWRRRRAVDNA